MATRTISTKLAIEGESQYRESMSRINAEIKSLQSGLKLTESQFQNNANSMAALTAKGDALNSLYTAQSAKVKELKAALENARTAEESYAAKKQELTAKLEANNAALQTQDASVIAAGKSWANQAEIVARCEAELKKLRSTTGDTGDAQAELEAKINAAKEKMAALESETGGAAKTTGELLLHNKELNAEVQKNESYLNAASRGVTSWEYKLNRAEIQLNDTNAKIQLNNQYLEEASNSADGCATSIDRFGDRVKESANNANALRDALMAAGVVAALKATADALEDCAGESIKFESAMAGVSKTTDLADDELAAMGDAIQDLATKIPATASEIANVAEAAGQLGIAKEDILAFSEVMVNLGVATNLSATEAASALAKFANVVGMSSDNYERLGSTIVALGNNFATTEADIVSMATRLASTGAIVGLTESQIMAVAAALSSVGIEAEAGGSAISKLLKKFETMVQTGSPKLQDFAAIAGMTADEFAAAWGENAVQALSLFIDGLGAVDAAGGSSVAVLEDLGLTEIRLSNAVTSLASSKGILTKALNTANTAWEENTALSKEAATRYETTESKLQLLSNAADNAKIAIGDQLTPAIGNLADTGAEVLNWAADFIDRHESIVPVVTAVASAIGVLAAGITSYVAVTKLAGVATAAFTAVLDTNPVFLVVTAIAALAAGIGALAVTMESATSEYDALSAASKQQYDELQNLQAEYDRVCDVYGETSAEAQLLKKQVDDASAAFEENKKTAEEVTTAINETVNAHNDLVASYQKTVDGIKSEGDSATNLAKKLESLMAVENKTAGTKQEILAIVDLLNESIPELGLAYDEYSDSLNVTTESLEKLVEAEIERERYQADFQHYKDLLKESTTLENAATEAADESAAAKQRLADAQAELTQAEEKYKDLERVDWQGYATLMEPYYEALIQAQGEVDVLTEAENTAKTAYEENGQAIDQLREEIGDYVEEVKEAADAQEAFAFAQQEVRDRIDELAQAYADAYDAARSSIEGQIGLFDTFEATISKDTDTVEKMMSRWLEQTENLASYTENLKKAAQYGLDEGLVLSLSNGSAESAGYLATIIEEIERLGGTTEGMSSDAAAFVDEFNASFAKTEQAKDEFAETVATMETDFSETVGNIEQTAADVDFSGFKEAMNEAFADVGHDFEQIGNDAATGLSSGINGAASEVTGSAQSLAEETLEATRTPIERDSEGIGEEFVEKVQHGVEEVRPELVSTVEDMGDEVTETLTDSAKESVESYYDEFSQISAKVNSTLTELKATVNDSMSSLPGSMYGIGQESVNGMINGMNSRSGSLYSTVRSIVNSAISAARRAAAVNSPSKKTTEIFEFVGDGMAVGLENRRKKVKETAQSVVDDALKLDITGNIGSAISNINTSPSPEFLSEIMRASSGSAASTPCIKYNFGDVNVQIYQRSGEDDVSFAYRVLEIAQMEINKKEAGL